MGNVKKIEMLVITILDTYKKSLIGLSTNWTQHRKESMNLRQVTRNTNQR